METTEQGTMRREALEEAASYVHPDTIPTYAVGVDLGGDETTAVVLEVHPDGARTIVANAHGTDTHTIADMIRNRLIDHRFRLAIRAALTGAILFLAACGGRVDAPEHVTCSTPEGSAPLPAASVVVTATDGALRASESCENDATCYVLSTPSGNGRGTEIVHVVRGACVVSR